PRRVVRVADVHDVRPRPDRGQHRVEVVTVVTQGDADGHRSLLGGVDHVARERRPAADDLVAGIEDRLREAVDQPVRTGADRDLLEADAEPLGEGIAELPGAAVRIAVQILDAAGESLDRGGKWSERPLVRGELDAALEAELALHLLDRLA